jgi:DNA polymerase-3 subunit beta
MRFIAQRQDLFHLLTRLQTVVGQKAALPILSNILLEAKGNLLTVVGTDLVIGLKAFAEAKVFEEGITTLPARRLTQLIRELTCHAVEISKGKDDIVEITANASRFKIHSLPATEYPPFPDMQGAKKFEIDAKTFRESLYKTAFAVSKEDSRYVLTGVLVRMEEGLITFVGTDGKRLSKAHLPPADSESFQGNYILPIRAVEELLRNLEGEERMNLYLQNERVAIETPSFFFTTKLLPGEFPDFMRVIPEKPQEMLTLHREELTSLLRQVSLFTADSSQSVRFTFAPQELRLSANAADVGEGRVTMPVQYSGEKIDIAFNPGYFLDILRHCKGETVTLGLTDSFNPGLLIDQEEGSPFHHKTTPLFMLMPMRLDGN